MRPALSTLERRLATRAFAGGTCTLCRRLVIRGEGIVRAVTVHGFGTVGHALEHVDCETSRYLELRRRSRRWARAA